MQIRKTLYAEEGKILTNGEDYGKIIFLAVGKNEEDYYEITEAEYESIMAEKEALNEGI